MAFLLVAVLLLAFNESAISQSTYLDIPQLVEDLDNIYDFRTIYYISESAEKLQPERSNNPSVVISNIQILNLKFTGKTSLFVVAFIAREKEKIFRFFEKIVIENLTKVIFILSEKFPVEDLLRIFEWCWQNGIVNALAVGKDCMYSYEPFPEMILTNLINETNLHQLFRNKLTNFHRKPVKILSLHDIPRSFTYTNHKGVKSLSGYMLRVVLAFVEKHNGVVAPIIHYNSNSTFQQLESLLKNRTIDIAPNIFNNYPGNVSMSFPVMHIDTCVVMPYSAETPRYYSFKLPFRNLTWCTIVLGFVAFFMICCATLALTESNCFFGTTLHCVIRTALLQFDGLPRHLNHMRFMFSLILVFSMLIGSLYQSGLSSYFTKSVPGVQIDTYEDWNTSEFSALFTIGGYEMIKHKQGLPKEMLTLIKPVPTETYQLNIFSLNTKYGYILTDDNYELIRQISKYEPQPIFHRSKMCFGSAVFCIPQRQNSPYKDILNRVVSQTRDTGLFIKWKRDAFDESKEIGFMKGRIVSERLLRPLATHDLIIAWIIFAAGTLLSGVVYLSEYFVNKLCYYLKE